jgi:ABC-type amino acid transport system permease subunit
MSPIEVLWTYKGALAAGFATTAGLVGIVLVCGTVMGLALEWASARLKPIRPIIDVIAFCISAVPALVILFWLYYPAQTLTGIGLTPFWTAAAALLVLNTFAIYRITADAVADFPKQFIATGLVSGLTSWQIVRYIQAPLMARWIAPRWIDQQVIILQTSVFASLISVEEIFRVAQRINSRVYEPVTIYTAMALIFLATAGSGLLLAKHLRRRFDRDFSER